MWGQLRDAISEWVEEVGHGDGGDVRMRPNDVSLSMEYCFLAKPQLSPHLLEVLQKFFLQKQSSNYSRGESTLLTPT